MCSVCVCSSGRLLMEIVVDDMIGYDVKCRIETRKVREAKKVFIFVKREEKSSSYFLVKKKV